MIISKLAAPAAGLALGLAFVNLVESALPVTMRMQAAPVSYEASSYTVEVTGYKVRSCIVVPGTLIGWYMTNGTWYETPLTFPDDKTPNSSKPKSYSPVSFGLFRWHNLALDAEQVKMTVVHSCDGHLEITTVGPWPIEGVAQ